MTFITTNKRNMCFIFLHSPSIGVVETVVVVDDVVNATVDSSVDLSVLDGGEVGTVEERVVGTGVVVPVKHSRQRK